MKICIVGATGYIGSYFANFLNKKNNYDLIAVVRNKSKNKLFLKKNFSKIIHGQIEAENTVKKIVSLRPNYIIYTVSLNQKKSEENISESFKVGVFPLYNLVKKIKFNKIKTRIIYLSTVQVYGNLNNYRVVNEYTPKLPLNIYSVTHSFCEDYLLENRDKNLKINILRLSNIFGSPELKSCDCWWLVLNDFCKTAMQKKYIEIKSDGKSVRDFHHIDNVCEAMYQILMQRLNSPSIINISSGKTYSVLEVAKKVYEIFNKSGSIRIILQNKKITINKLNDIINSNKISRPKITNSTNKINNFNIQKTNISEGIKLFKNSLLK